MKPYRIMAAIVVCLLIALANPAEAKKYRTHARADSGAASHCVFDNDGRQVCGGAVNRVLRPSVARNDHIGGVNEMVVAHPASSGFASNSLVSEARKYLGTNPTGRARLWCGAFMDLVLRRTGHAGGGNLAKSYASYGTRVSGPQVGAIAVMGRKGGGHVGVVSGIDANGNPVIISGNHNRTTAESVYPASRIIAYVMPRQ